MSQSGPLLALVGGLLRLNAGHVDSDAARLAPASTSKTLQRLSQEKDDG
jgi:hypothetical protein